MLSSKADSNEQTDVDPEAESFEKSTDDFAQLLSIVEQAKKNRVILHCWYNMRLPLNN